MKKRKAFALVLIGLMLATSVLPAMVNAEDERTLHIVAASDGAVSDDRLLYHLYQRIGYNIYLDAMPMKIACETANTGSADGLAHGSASFVEEYTNLVLLPEVFSSIRFDVFALENTALTLRSWADLKGLRVGTLYQKVHINRLLPDDIASQTQYVSLYEMNQALIDDQIDVYVSSVGVNQTLETLTGVKNIGTLEEVKTYHMVNKQNEALIPKLCDALREMKADGTYDAIVGGTYPKATAKKVLHISSYSPEDIWDSELQLAMVTEFDKVENILYYNVPLNSSRLHSFDEIVQTSDSAIRTLLMDRRPDLVIVSDNIALRLAMQYGASLFENTPIIYCGITDSDAFFESIDGIYYGLREKVSTMENIQMIEKLCPDEDTLFIINDSSPTGMAVLKTTQDTLQGYSGRMQIRHNQSLNLQDLLDEMDTLDEGTPILLGSFTASKHGNAETRQYIIRKITEHASGPLFSEASMGNGETGGIRSSAALQGKAIAKIALEVLSGTELSQIDYPAMEELTVSEFDWNKLQAYQLSERNLPEGAKVINRPQNLYDVNPTAYYLTILSISLLLTLFVIMTLYSIRIKRHNVRLKQAQESLVSLSEVQKVNAELSQSSARLNFAIDSAKACAWEVDIEKQLLIFDDKLKDILEFELDSPAPLSEFSAYYRSLIQDRKLEAGQLLGAFINTAGYSNEVKLLLPSGKRRHLSAHAQRYADENGNITRVFGLLVDTTTQVEALNNAQRAAMRVLNSIDEQIYVSDIDTDELLFVNSAMVATFGVEDYKGHKCWDMFMKGEKRCEFCPKYHMSRDRVESYVWENKQPLLDRHYRHVDKYIKWVDGQQVLLHVMFDISDIRNAEQALQKQFEQQKLVADISASLIQLGDLDELVYQTLEKTGMSFDSSRMLLATTSEDGQWLVPTYEWIHPLAKNQQSRKQNASITEGAQLYECLRASGDQPSIIGEDDIKAIAGEEMMLRSALVLKIMVDGVFAGIFEVAHEQEHTWSANEIQVAQSLCNIFAMLISRQKIAESLVEAKEAAEEANYAKSQFLSTMSHEIRTPLNAIIGLVQVLMQKDVGPEVSKRLCEIAASSDHLLSIINDVLDMSKIEAGKVVLTAEPFELGIAIDEVVVIFRQRMQEAGIRFDCVFEGLENLYVLLDKLILKQVLINLLSNAVKFTERGGDVDFIVRVVTQTTEQAMVYFEVRDSGIGMDKEQVAKLFRPFEQTKHSISAQYGGTGLGLAISKHLVELMGGTMGVQSDEGKGSRFWFTLSLPLCAAPDSPMPSVGPTNKDFTGKHILLVEDIAINRQILIELLSDTGVSFDEAENGLEALEKYITEPEKYDLVLMDMLMPKMDGLEATRQIRKLDDIRNTPVPIVALTANAFADDVNACIAAGMQGHISKPIDYQELIEVIGRFL